MFRPYLRLSKRSARGGREPREVPRVKRQPVFSINSRAFFDDAMLLWLLMTWLIKGGLSKLSGVLSEISGGLLDLVYLWLTNQIAELH